MRTEWFVMALCVVLAGLNVKAATTPPTSIFNE